MTTHRRYPHRHRETRSPLGLFVVAAIMFAIIILAA
jgi:hypothetical protein